MASRNISSTIKQADANTIINSHCISFLFHYYILQNLFNLFGDCFKLQLNSFGDCFKLQLNSLGDCFKLQLNSFRECFSADSIHKNMVFEFFILAHNCETQNKAHHHNKRPQKGDWLPAIHFRKRCHTVS